MKTEVLDRDDIVHRVDDRDGHSALGRRVDRWPRTAVGEAGHRERAYNTARRAAEDRYEPLHGCLTTSTPFMKGCGVQWKANSPGCVNVWDQVLPGTTAAESHHPSSAIIVGNSGTALVQTAGAPAEISTPIGAHYC